MEDSVFLKYKEETKEFDWPLRPEDIPIIESAFRITLSEIKDGNKTKAFDRLQKGKTYTVEGIAIDSSASVLKPTGATQMVFDETIRKAAEEYDVWDRHKDANSTGYIVNGCVINGSSDVQAKLSKPNPTFKDVVEAAGGYRAYADVDYYKFWEGKILGPGTYRIRGQPLISLGKTALAGLIDQLPSQASLFSQPHSLSSSKVKYPIGKSSNNGAGTSSVWLGRSFSTHSSNGEELEPLIRSPLVSQESDGSSGCLQSLSDSQQLTSTTPCTASLNGSSSCLANLSNSSSTNTKAEDEEILFLSEGLRARIHRPSRSEISREEDDM
eukprot:TRINITY_DN677_c0_g4_i3.p1 TRINITY_DN677_c0_g4~~TRINITY_DN677_c0_g4_i3.p1  ORF type:complete len:326 (-),score=34.61 TRINITY_DN677_c0_g4_i3:17-994(-)